MTVGGRRHKENLLAYNGDVRLEKSGRRESEYVIDPTSIEAVELRYGAAKSDEELVPAPSPKDAGWAMTTPQILAAIDAMSTTAREPEPA